ncbi:FxsA family membrane protein [Streptomyces sp. JJ38]|uniref:FxsA family membrane protein n=1 Tax=Streptomyces sp. JJ38 TaxID=2738128 RepID=UPI001C574387|nr:FxsA family membrane protein [Streptomyces sp. JJ38]MBW1599441.1 FxsA family protein [Streptomyces sp. JJ38]
MSTREPSPYERPRRGPGGRSLSDRPRRRSRRSVLLPLTVAVWTVLELWLLILVGDAAGGWTVFLLLVAGFLLGALAIKRAGRRAWSALAETLQQPGAAPSAETARGGGNALAMLGGLLLMLPGLLSDVLGLLCLFPPTARLLRRGTERWLSRQAGRAAPGTLGEALHEARRAGEQVRIRRPDGPVIQGEVIDPEDTGDGPGRRTEGGPEAPSR